MRIEVAKGLATAVHAGQVDKAGNPYIGHPARVAGYVEQMGGAQHQIVAAWLHDVVEDSALTVEDLLEFGVSFHAIDMIDAISKRKGESRPDYYERVKQTPGALLVKHADLKDNTDPQRMALLDEETRARLTKKYDEAHQALGLPSPFAV